MLIEIWLSLLVKSWELKLAKKILQNYPDGTILFLQIEYPCDVSSFSYVEFKIFLKLCM